MKRFMIGVSAVVVAVGLAACDVEKDNKKAEQVSEDTSEQVSEEPEVDPNPEGEFRIASCDLGSGNELVGSVRIMNTGDVPLTAEVPFSWELEDGSTIDAETQQEELGASKSRLVFFNVPASLNEQLAFQGHPGYFRSKNCASKVQITS
jgi:hypothetical protein